MRTIWKFPVPFLSGDIVMPKGAKVLGLQLQQDVPTLWAAVDPGNPNEIHHLVTYGTGDPIDPKAGSYIGTFQIPPFVWHVYDVSGSLQATEQQP